MSDHISRWGNALLKRWRNGWCMTVAFWANLLDGEAIEVQARCWDSSKA